jgi:hypothetical protein
MDATNYTFRVTIFLDSFSYDDIGLVGWLDVV